LLTNLPLLRLKLSLKISAMQTKAKIFHFLKPYGSATRNSKVLRNRVIVSASSFSQMMTIPGLKEIKLWQSRGQTILPLLELTSNYSPCLILIKRDLCLT
jgi:hypothetical protein